MYTLTWRTPSLNANKGSPINVGAGLLVSNRATLTLSGQAATNFGEVTQENVLALLERHAGPTPPATPTVGQLWYDTAASTLKIATSTPDVPTPTVATWDSVGLVASGATPPPTPAPGDLWLDQTGQGSGVLYVFTGAGRFPDDGPAVGGWAQLWPRVEQWAARDEYDDLAADVTALLGPASAGGGGALGRYLDLTDLPALDASLAATFAAEVPPDPNVLSPVDDPTTELKLEPTSQDWDRLLTATRYATGRLEPSASLAAGVSAVPFVVDGRAAPPELLALPTSDPRYPPAARRAGRRRHSLVGARAPLAATSAAVAAALTDRYSLLGVAGTGGAQPAFDPSALQVAHAAYAGELNATSGTMSLLMRFATQDALERFFNSAGVLQVVASHLNPVSPTAGDTALRNLLAARGRLRLTADKTRSLSPAVPPALVATGAAGAYDLGAGSTTLSTATAGGATFALAGTRVDPATLRLVLTVSAGATLTGTTRFAFTHVRGGELDSGAVPVYPAPSAWQASDSTGTSAPLLYVGPALPAVPPVADFTADVTSGGAPLTVNFSDTSTGNPTLVEWDFTNDGSFDATGFAVSHVYPAVGTFSVRQRASSVDGTDEETKVNYITVNGVPPGGLTTSPPSPTTTNTVEGSPVAFGVSAATGTAPLTYQWQRNGADILGATSSTYLFQCVIGDNGAQYRCRVSNAYGFAYTAIITLAVAPAPFGPVASTNGSLIAGEGGTIISLTGDPTPSLVAGSRNGGGIGVSGTVYAAGYADSTLSNAGDSYSFTASGYTGTVNYGPIVVSITPRNNLNWQINSSTLASGTSGFGLVIAMPGGGSLWGYLTSYSYSGTVPPGLTLMPNSPSLQPVHYVLSGNPTTPGSYPFTFTMNFDPNYSQAGFLTKVISGTVTIT